MFPPEGEIALMFLKSYTGQSDDGLVEMLNGNIYMQMFCGVFIDPDHPIKNGKIVPRICEDAQENACKNTKTSETAPQTP